MNAPNESSPPADTIAKIEAWLEAHMQWIEASVKRHVAESDYRRNAIEHKDLQPLRAAADAAQAKVRALTQELSSAATSHAPQA